MKKLSLLSLLFLQSAFADENEGLKVNPDHFITEGLLEPIKVEEKKLSNGEIADCYVIKTKSQPLEHKMGPWSPKTISDGKGGLWFEGGKLHNVDGAFIKNMATFYKDDKWKLYNEDGTLKVTETKEAFLLAARPNVDPAYQNHVVEGDPAWVKDLDFTYYIPVQPVALEKPGKLQRGAIGIAFNGVNYDPPAPTQMILKAYTIAPLDESGGHLNPHAGYHYHAATGKTKELKQEDGHASQIGYVIDGFPLFSYDKEAKLDECGGHYDKNRKYHYHAGEAGSNQVIKALKGATVLTESDKKHPPRGERPHNHDRGKPHKH